MTITPQASEDVDRIMPIQFITAGKQTDLPAPFIRIIACGLLTNHRSGRESHQL
ncbi:MAG TPA: hypothetical protein VKX46_02245 [Ktedonobacteraceae bacterium]|jgi:hypothetical protein|nr:hypothetical protein [Ktedonobacteraceae bacterium]